MVRAPPLMAALFMVAACVVGLAIGEPRSFITLGVLGAIITVPLGYAYGSCVLLMQKLLVPR